MAVAGFCGCAACCAESLWLSGKRPGLNALVLSLVYGKAEPFRTAGGRAGIFSHLQRERAGKPSSATRALFSPRIPALSPLFRSASTTRLYPASNKAYRPIR